MAKIIKSSFLHWHPEYTIPALLSLVFLMMPGFVQSQPILNVVYPREGLTIEARDSAFVFGNVTPKGATVFVEGVKARKYANGTFLVMVPVSVGDFQFHAQAVWGKDTTEVLRSVYIPHYLTTWPVDSFGIDTSFVYPKKLLEVQAGDKVTFLFKGTPGSRAFFSIGGVVYDVPMSERKPQKPFDWGEAVFGQGNPPTVPEVKGIYAGSYIIQSTDPIGVAPIQFQLISKNGQIVVSFAPGRLNILDTKIPRVGILEQELTVGRAGPGKAYQFFLPDGVRLWIIGRDGENLRARLSEDEDVWIPANAFRFAPAGTPPPSSDVVTVRSESLPDRVRLKIFLQERLPFGIEQMARPQQLILKLFGATANTDWIRHDERDPSIGDIQWKQEKNEVYKLIINLNMQQQWGYRAFFQGTNLILDIKKAPQIHGWPGSPLKGLLICVDPGHGPDLGAIGPTGLKEKDATLEYAQNLKKLLEKKGARVFLTRDKEYGINLASRTKIAEAVNADIFVSIHFNALPDGVNPFASRGTSTYYYHPQSFPLARAIQKHLLRKTRLANFGLYYDNLSVCRITWMPSVLVEPAFIMHPLEEMKILDPKFRKKVCEGIVAGLEEFVKQAK